VRGAYRHLAGKERDGAFDADNVKKKHGDDYDDRDGKKIIKMLQGEGHLEQSAWRADGRAGDGTPPLTQVGMKTRTHTHTHRRPHIHVRATTT